MSLETAVASVVDTESVLSVEFYGDTGQVRVVFDSNELFKGWPYGDSEWTHDELEAYLQDEFGISWSLEEFVTAPQRAGAGSQAAHFKR